MNELERLKKLAGLDPVQEDNEEGSNISYTGTEKAIYQRKHNIRPGDLDWFKLWFSRPYLTGSVDSKFRGRKK